MQEKGKNIKKSLVKHTHPVNMLQYEQLTMLTNNDSR